MQQQDIAIWLALQMKFENLQVQQTTCRPSAVHPRDQDDPHDDVHPEGENSANGRRHLSMKRMCLESHHLDKSMKRNEVLQLQQVSRDIIEEVSLTIDEAKLKKMADEMLRQRYPEAPSLSLINQDLLYLKKGSSGPEKIVLSLHKFPAIIFKDGDIEERTSRWIVARRANECIVSITEPDYKNLNKNHIEDMYLLIMNGKVPDYAKTGLLWSLSVFIISSVIWERVHDFQLGIESYQQKVNLTAPTISFLGVEKHKMFSIIYEPVHGIIYKNSKKEKRVMGHLKIHKFCDATLNRVLEGLKSYNNDVKYGYVQRELTNDEVEHLKLFEEEIEVRLKHRNQMRRWEIDVEETSKLIRSTTTLQPLLTIDPKDKGKGVLVEEEPDKLEKVKRRDQGLAQIESDAELAQRLHEEELAELDRA
ncbi:hypothetical protein Tco_0485255 [Tanacetum coccineum]